MSGALKVVSVNVGRERLVPWRGRMVPTGIFKEPVAGRVAVRDDKVVGDEIERLDGGREQLTVADLVRLASNPQGDPELLRRVLASDALPASWRDHYEREH